MNLCVALSVLCNSLYDSERAHRSQIGSYRNLADYKLRSAQGQDLLGRLENREPDRLRTFATWLSILNIYNYLQQLIFNKCF